MTLLLIFLAVIGLRMPLWGWVACFAIFTFADGSTIHEYYLRRRSGTNPKNWFR